MALVVQYCSTSTGTDVCGGPVPARPGENAQKVILAFIMCRGLGESGARDLRLGSLWSGAGRADDRYQTSLDRAGSGTVVAPAAPWRRRQRTRDDIDDTWLRFIFLQSVLVEM
jgi:hypothetical protein